MLSEGKQQPQKWHQKDASADAEHSRSNSANAGQRKDAGVTPNPIRHGKSPLLRDLAGLRAAIFSRAARRTALENNRTFLLSAAKPAEARSSCLQKRQRAFL